MAGFQMNRRRFLGLLAGAGAATATSYFLPPIGGWHSDVIAQPTDWDLKHFGRYDGCPLCLAIAAENRRVSVQREIDQAKAEYDALVEIGGLVGYYQPDGGSYFQGDAMRRYHKKLSDGRNIDAFEGALWVNKFPGSYEVVRV